MSIILYGLHGCPMCKFLEQTLKEKGIKYSKVDDLEKIQAIGLDSVPTLEVNGKRMNYPNAIKFIRCSEEKGGACDACVVGGF